MTASASNRLEQLQDEIRTMTASIEAMRDEYAALVTAGDDNEADTVAGRVRDAESRLAILNERLPVLTELAEQESDEARADEAAKLTAEANAKQADLKAKYAKAAKAVENLQKAVADIEENAALNWYIVANKAAQLGGDPDRTQIAGVREVLDNLDKTKRRLIGINEAYTHRIMQVSRGA